MRSATSCFNSTLYRKAMGRFWPLWALYGLIWLFALPLNLMTRYFDGLRWGAGLSDSQSWLLETAQELPALLPGGVWLALVFGVLAAMAVFGYLYNSRSACMMHALPLRRESLFTTQYLAGLTFLLLPQLAAAVLAALVELALLPAAVWGQALAPLGVWLLAQSASSLFFFSFAVFCAMFTGHILALPAFYGILNCLVMVLYSLVTALMSQFFYGFSSRYDGSFLVEVLTPVYALSEACDWDIQYAADGLSQSFLRAPGAVAAYAAAGLVFAVLALLVYRSRHVESAGDVVAIPLVRPVFLAGVTFCSGLCFGFATSFFLGLDLSRLALSLCVLFWSAVGYFAAQMLLKKTFRVFHTWKGCLVGVALMALLCAVLALDLFGVEGRVPDADQVVSVDLRGSFGAPYDSGGDGWSGLTDPRQINEVLALHRAIVADRDRADYNSGAYEPGDSYISYSVTYHLAGGGTLHRNYNSVPVYRDETGRDGSVTQAALALLQDRELLALAYNFDFFAEGRLVEAYLSDVYLLPDSYSPEGQYQGIHYLDGAAGEDLAGLWQAVLQDFADGTIGVRYLFDDQERLDNTYRSDLSFTFDFTQPGEGSGRPAAYSYSNTLTITLTPNARRTLAWLEEMSALGAQYRLVTHSDGSGAEHELVYTS